MRSINLSSEHNPHPADHFNSADIFQEACFHAPVNGVDAAA